MTAIAHSFERRHIGIGTGEEREMLKKLGVPSVESLISQIVPQRIRVEDPLNLPEALSEEQALHELYAVMNQNTAMKSFIGQGYHGCHVPAVIKRNMFENPAWYTSYTPYQAEISQGRLEMLFHFQTLISELTGLPVAGASLLDEATAVAEAIGIAYRHHREKRLHVSFAGELHSQVRDVIETRAIPLGLELTDELPGEGTAALIVPWPDTKGIFGDYSRAIAAAKENGTLVVAVADPLALVLLEAPANWGADMAVGSMQRYGVPMGFGGPHAAYMAVSDALTRLMPGRLVGQSVDTKGRAGYRLALQTREQHIRREKATSNICTAQALLANMSAAFAIWHGRAGLENIADSIHGLAVRFYKSLEKAGTAVANGAIFDTVTVTVPGKAAAIAKMAEENDRLLRVIDKDTLSVAFDETSNENDLDALCGLFDAAPIENAPEMLPERRRGANFMTQPVFYEYRSETEMLRYLRKLADQDLALDRTMIPLGSCTMKLNAAAEMDPVSWPTISALHPFAPGEHAKGYLRMISDLENWLGEITGFDAVSLQPNAGSQGEYAGLLAIRRYLNAHGGKDRDLCLIPSSAHGTNPASAHMAGFEIAIVKCTEQGNIDLDDLKAKVEENSARLAALMITYPSTHGVFEEGIRDICALIHENGGQVYLDGANMNAMVGIARPGDIGADVCHLNLHKTFCIPHGGGGPGVGPIGVKAHLAEFLPGHVMNGTSHAVAAAPFGSASILPITWMYIRMMGPDGLKRASEVAILSANYIAARLNDYFPVLYSGRNGRVAHECILDTRVLKQKADIGVEDVAKRLIDYGFHAPTMSWPVAGTLMVEPTESEPKAELDRFCDAMISIASEAEKVANGEWPKDDNPLINSPHTAGDTLADDWKHPYSRRVAVFPATTPDGPAKYWPPVSRIDNVYGDRNLVCACPPIEALAS
jgi:glycine dehydrogenase